MTEPESGSDAYTMNLLGDGQLGLDLCGKIHERGSGLHALGDHFHLHKNFLQRASLAELDANMLSAEKIA